MTDWYTASGNPTQSSSVASNVLRSEYSSIAAAFSKMPTLTGYNGLLVGVNSSGTALSTYSYPEILSALNAAELGANVTFLTINGTIITASTQFSGPGTGLTGTAAGLSIGGNATTATTANALNPANNYQVTNFTYTGTLTGSTGIMNIGSGQIYKDASGNVGIGTNSPVSNSLSITQYKNLSWVWSDGANYANIFNQAGSASLILASGYKLSSTAHGFASSFAGSWSKSAIEVGGGGAIKFFVDDATTVAVGTDITPTERMRIDSSGNVGVGTTTPSQKLDVNGYVKTSSGIKFPDGTTQTTAGVGIGQTWQDVTSSRAANTTYTNSSGKPIQIIVSLYQAGQNTSSTATLTISGVAVAYASSLNNNAWSNIPEIFSAIIPNGETYSVSATGSYIYSKWSELR